MEQFKTFVRRVLSELSADRLSFIAMVQQIGADQKTIIASINQAAADLKTIIADIQKETQLIMTSKEELDALTAQVTENENTEQSAIVLLNNISAQLIAQATDPVAVNALGVRLKASAAALAAAITANTPAAPPAPAPTT